MKMLFTVIVAILATYFAPRITKLIAVPTVLISNTLHHICEEGDSNFSDAERKTAEEYAERKDEQGRSVKMLLSTMHRS